MNFTFFYSDFSSEEVFLSPEQLTIAKQNNNRLIAYSGYDECGYYFCVHL